MNQNEVIEQEKAALQRFVSSLMWLARFCGWLAYFPRPLRNFILKHYRLNEVLLRIRILDLIQDYGFWSEVPELTWSPSGDTRDDARRLAVRFETLAGMIDELLEIAPETLAPIAAGMVSLQERPRTRLFMRVDDFKRYISALVFLPREHFNTELRQNIAKLLSAAFGLLMAWHTGPWAQVGGWLWGLLLAPAALAGVILLARWRERPILTRETRLRALPELVLSAALLGVQSGSCDRRAGRRPHRACPDPERVEHGNALRGGPTPSPQWSRGRAVAG